MTGSLGVGPFLFVPVGGTWVRLDRVEIVTDFDVVMVSGYRVELGDGETALTALDDWAGRSEVLR